MKARSPLAAALGMALVAPLFGNDVVTSFEGTPQRGFPVIVSKYPYSLRFLSGKIGDPGDPNLVRTGQQSFTTTAANTSFYIWPAAASIEFWARDEDATVESTINLYANGGIVHSVQPGTTWTKVSYSATPIEFVDILSQGPRVAIDDLTYCAVALPPRVGTNYCGPAAKNRIGLSAVIAAYGSVIAMDNDLVLSAGDMGTWMHNYFLASMTQDLIQTPFGATVCLGSPTFRLLTTLNLATGAGTSYVQLDLTNTPKGHSIVSGETWHFQCWYRDPHPGKGSNFTDGVTITFQ